MKTKIEITQKHIDTGIQESADACPIALAIKERFYNTIYGDGMIIVGDTEIEFNGKRFCVPKKASNFIHSFDRYLKVRPFSFILKEIKNEDYSNSR